ncbi:hypothetical protein ACRE_038030 [Hapsidospora chrysogenum ATCC 11550]|uniref:Uncharacterized protein n=1 Tax=Hapsidospora chrysogenum (strain ATCC 11550 / CBS 779.69 / DSM 880 / IAM 14645 / JCM 23072 / IMI 49137) TaxID=857340 RepID=A0A086T7R2_HAPC1|nr:hypothetical protein ACRE_038030 [Hapsidospora chrysogenum ATCC 11550]
MKLSAVLLALPVVALAKPTSPTDPKPAPDLSICEGIAAKYPEWDGPHDRYCPRCDASCASDDGAAYEECLERAFFVIRGVFGYCHKMYEDQAEICRERIVNETACPPKP